MLNWYQANAVAADHWFGAHDAVSQHWSSFWRCVKTISWQCSLDTKQKSYLTNQCCIRSIFLNSILLFVHVHLSGISKKDEDGYNSDVKHQERSFGVKFDNGDKLCRQRTNWCSSCSISKQITCRQAIKKDLFPPALQFFWQNNKHNSLPATLTTIRINYLPKHDVARTWNESRNQH